MKNLSKIFLIAISIGLFNLPINASMERDSTNIDLCQEGGYDIYIEPSLQSPYIFIPPKGLYNLKRITVSGKSIIETYLDNKNTNSRYRMPTGFFFSRTNNDSISNYRYDESKTKKAIEEFCDLEITGQKVFLYDQEYISISKDGAICEGKIFSPFLDATGLFFLKRQNPPYHGKNSTDQAFYLFFYSFDLAYDLAKIEFEKIASYIHYVNQGLIE